MKLAINTVLFFVASLGSLVVFKPQLARSQDFDWSLVPGDTVAIGSVDLDQLRNDPELELMPWEIMSAASVEAIGFDVATIQSAKIIVGMPTINGPEVGVVLSTSSSYDIDKLSSKAFKETEAMPKRKELRFRQATDGSLQVVQLGENSFAFGTVATLRKMLLIKNKSSRIAEVAKRDFGSPAIDVALVVDPIRPLIAGLLESPDISIPEELYPKLQSLLEDFDHVRIGSFLGDARSLKLQMGAKDTEAAEQLNEKIKEISEEEISRIAESFKSDLENSPESVPTAIRDATVKYIDRVALKAKGFLDLEQEDDHLNLKLEKMESVGTTGVLVGLLLPAVQAAREAARRTSSSNNLKQIGLALLNYEDAYKRIPAAAITDKEGNPLLSWRVAILPYIEQQELYNRFHLDEPWDSEHNIQLLEEIPATLRHPSSVSLPGYTSYLAIVGDKTAIREKGTQFRDIVDGTSNTIMVIEVNDAHAVPWTKPDDIPSEDLSADVFGPSQGGSNTVFVDGSVRFLSNTIDPEILKALITINGGEAISPE